MTRKTFARREEALLRGIGMLTLLSSWLRVGESFRHDKRPKLKVHIFSLRLKPLIVAFFWCRTDFSKGSRRVLDRIAGSYAIFTVHSLLLPHTSLRHCTLFGV